MLHSSVEEWYLWSVFGGTVGKGQRNVVTFSVGQGVIEDGGDKELEMGGSRLTLHFGKLAFPATTTFGYPHLRRAPQR